MKNATLFLLGLVLIYCEGIIPIILGAVCVLIAVNVHNVILNLAYQFKKEESL